MQLKSRVKSKSSPPLFQLSSSGPPEKDKRPTTILIHAVIRWLAGRPKTQVLQACTALLFLTMLGVHVSHLRNSRRNDADSHQLTMIRNHNIRLAPKLQNNRYNNNLVAKQVLEPISFYPLGVKPRAFTPWHEQRRGQLPCYKWTKKNSRKKNNFEHGFFFQKAYKTGGSTAVGIHLRYTHRLAKQMGISSKISKMNYPTNCVGHWGHAAAHKIYPDRDWRRSFLWTVVRDPTQRAVSEFFHFKVSRENMEPSFENFRYYLMNRRWIKNHYPKLFSTDVKLIGALEQNSTYENAKKVLEHIGWSEYDFIGVTERMDETAVAFMMLLNGTIGDILHLNAKNQGEYDDICVKITPTHLTPEMENFLESDEWKERIKWDKAIHDWANLSLNVTILGLNATIFGENLRAFRHAQSVVQKECGDLDVYPCTSDGKVNRKKDCLWSDAGCAFQCVNEVAYQLGLDEELETNEDDDAITSTDDEDDDDDDVKDDDFEAEDDDT